jgi:hypothetical protein
MICRGGSDAEGLDLGWNWSSPDAVRVRTSGEDASATIGTDTDAGAAARETKVDNSASMVFKRACTSALLLSKVDHKHSVDGHSRVGIFDPVQEWSAQVRDAPRYALRARLLPVAFLFTPMTLHA